MPRIRPKGLSLASANASYRPLSSAVVWHPRTGVYWTHPNTRATAATAQSLLTAAPVVVAAAGSIARLGAIVGVAVAGSTVRLGVYADSGGQPAALLLDAGTIDGNSATAQEITLGTPLAVAAGQRIWLAAVNQGGAPTVRGLSLGPTGDATSLANALAAATAGSGWSVAGVTGNLPDPFGSPTACSGSTLIAILGG